MSTKKIKRWLLFFVVTTVTVLLINRMSVVASFHEYPKSPEYKSRREKNAADNWSPCLPTGTIDAQLIGEHEGDFTLYAIWQLRTDNNQPFLFASGLYGGEGGVCGHVWDSRYEQVMSPEYIRTNDARALAVLLYEYRIEEAGGLANFQNIMDEALSEPSVSYFPPEFIYAMQQLGVNLPDGSYEAISPDGVPSNQRQP